MYYLVDDKFLESISDLLFAQEKNYYYSIFRVTKTEAMRILKEFKWEAKKIDKTTTENLLEKFNVKVEPSKKDYCEIDFDSPNWKGVLIYDRIYEGFLVFGP